MNTPDAPIDEPLATLGEMKALRESWAWTHIVLPYLNLRCAALMEEGLEPVPPSCHHDDARYRLAELRELQRFLDSVEENARNRLQGIVDGGSPR